MNYANVRKLASSLKDIVYAQYAIQNLGELKELQCNEIL